MSSPEEVAHGGHKPDESDARSARKPHGRETMGGLAKGLAIVELFDGTRTRITAADAARETGTSRATARRCLLTLEELGYVARRDGQTFEACARMMRLGRGYQQPASLAEAAAPHLERVRDELQEPAALSVLEGNEVLIIARAESSRIVTTGVKAGGRLPLYCSATGRVLAGELTADEIARRLARTEFRRLTEKTTRSVEEFVQRVREARTEGYAVSDEEMEMGMRSMAVPIHGPDGRVTYALSMSTSSARTSLDEMKERYLPILRRNLRHFEELIREAAPGRDA